MPPLQREMCCGGARVSKTCAGVMAWHRTAVCCRACLATAMKKHCTPQLPVPGNPWGPTSALSTSPSHIAPSHGFCKASQRAAKSGHSESTKWKATRIVSELASRSQREQMEDSRIFSFKMMWSLHDSLFQLCKRLLSRERDKTIHHCKA